MAADSVYCYRHFSSSSNNSNTNGNSQKKLTFARTPHTDKEKEFAELGGIGDAPLASGVGSVKSDLYGQLNQYSNSLVEVCSQRSDTSAEIDQLRVQVAKARYFLDAISEKLDTLSLSSNFSGAGSVTTSADIAQPATPVVPTRHTAYKPPIHYGGKSSVPAESIYVGFANEESLARTSTQNLYEQKSSALPADSYRLTAETEKPAAKVGGEERFDLAAGASFMEESPLDTAISGDFGGYGCVGDEFGVAQKKPMNAGNSVYHARDLLNDFYA